ncbi:MAG: 50S ribosomal protein L23 [Candidatus Omnitrophota bacterium]
MRDSRDVVKGLLRTEKGSRILPLNKYLFWVDKNANKIEIRKAIENIYNVKVESVNSVMMRGKLRRLRNDYGKSADWKKAIVTLKKGAKIDVT